MDVPAYIARPYTFALVSDLHNEGFDPTLALIDDRQPDGILIAGDLIENVGAGGTRGLAFLSEASKRFPVFYGFGNHERFIKPEEYGRITKTGVTPLVGTWTHFGPFVIGGMPPVGAREPKTTAFLRAFSAAEGYRILLCHRPEWYMPYVRPYDIPLVCAGHAHGGQFRILGRGVFAPGQGLFPKYTEGLHDGRLLIGRGLGNHVIAPRLWNRPEVCMITLRPKPI